MIPKQDFWHSMNGILRYQTGLIFSIFIIYSMLSAQDQIQYLTVNQGLSQNSITCLLQDKQGYIWIGTQQGLSRYDGYRFSVYKHHNKDEHSLNHNTITALFEDKQGALWIGAMQGLNKWNEYGQNFKRYSDGVVTSIADFFPHFYPDEKDRYLWVGAASGLMRFDKYKGEFMPAGLISGEDGYLNQKYVHTLLAGNTADQDILWVGLRDSGLVRLSCASAREISYQRIPIIAAGSAQYDFSAYCLIKDHTGKIWLGTDRGLYSAEAVDTVFIPVRRQISVSEKQLSLNILDVRCLCDDNSGALWIGTAEHGVWKLNFENHSGQQIFPDRANLVNISGISDCNITSIFRDRSGIIWFGTHGGGLNKYIPQYCRIRHYVSDYETGANFSGKSVWAVCQDNFDQIWLGKDRGVALLNRSGALPYKEDKRLQNIRLNNELFGQPVRAIAQNKNGTLWFGTLGNGLFKYNPLENRQVQYKNNPSDPFSLSKDLVYAIYIDKKDTVWVGTNGGGLSRLLDENTGRFLNYRTFNDLKRPTWIISIAELDCDQDQSLWLGSWGDGLIKFNPQTGKYIKYKNNPDDPESLNNNYVFSICEPRLGEKDIIWVGAYGGGLNRFDLKTGKFKCYTETEGLANNVVYGILEDCEGNLWMSTDQGISKFHPQTETFVNYDLKDGLQGNEFCLGSYFKDKNGDLYFGGANGLNGISGGNNCNHLPPEVVLTSVKVYNKELDLKQSLSETQYISLNHNQNSLTFEFVALHYKNSLKNQYACYLDGFDRQWINLGNRRSVSYNDLEPGHYVFKVRATNCDGVWNDKARELIVNISWPFWKTTWFYALMFVVAFFSAYYYRQSGIEHALQIERVRASEREAIRQKVAADFHDVLGHRVTKIALSGRMLQQQYAADYDPDSKLLGSITENADALFREIKDFIWELDPTKESLQEFIIYLKNFSDTLFDNTDICFSVQSEIAGFENFLLPMEWRRHLLALYKEAMNNVLKHSKGCRTVVLGVGFDGKELRVFLSDDGCGFDPDAPARGNGVKNMRNRADKLGGSLDVVAADSKGVSIIFTAKLS
jgi:ligand-binding sensor domain-containing protein/signal transduction histidine kinase